MSLDSKIKKASIWQTFEVLSQSILQFGYFAIMARLLLKEDYGLMAIASGIIGVGSVFVDGGMGTALIQKKNITNRHINAAFQISFLFGLTLFLIFFFTAPLLSELYSDIRLEPIIKVISFNFLMLAIGSISISLLYKKFKFKETSRVTVFSVIIGYLIGIYFAYNDYGVWSLIYATLTSTLIKTVGHFMYAPFKFQKAFFCKEGRELFKFGSGMLLLSLCNFFAGKGLNLVLGKIFAPGLLGVFDRAFQLKTIPSQFLGKIMDKIMFPAMAEIQDEEDRMFRVYNFSLGVGNSIMIPLAVYLIFFTPEIVAILLGDKWQETIIPLQIMFAVLPLSNSGRMADSIIRAKGLVYKNVTRKIIYAVLIIGLTSVFGYLYGIVGASLGVLSSFIINYLMMIFLVKKIFKKSFSETFLIPLFEGLRLGLFVTLFSIIYNTVLNVWGETQVFLFIGYTMVLGASLIFVILKRPNWLGKYLSLTVKKFLNK